MLSVCRLWKHRPLNTRNRRAWNRLGVTLHYFVLYRTILVRSGVVCLWGWWWRKSCGKQPTNQPLVAITSYLQFLYKNLLCPQAHPLSFLPSLFYFPAFKFFALISSRILFLSRVLLSNTSASITTSSKMSLQNKLSIKDLDLKGKRVFIRVGMYNCTDLHQLYGCRY